MTTTPKAPRKTAPATKATTAAKTAPAKKVPTQKTPAKKVAAKAAAPVKPAAAPAPVAAKPKHKLVRDSFTIPKPEYAVLEGLKHRAAQLKQPTKKSELLRAGIAVLNALSDKAFLEALAGVPSLKAGRPKREAASDAR